MPVFFNWHAELYLHAALLLVLIFHRTGLRWWSAWVTVRFVFDLAQMLLERSGQKDLAANVWYFGNLHHLLLIGALWEAKGRYHRAILFTWTGLMMTAAWIRFFPYTGRAVILIDAAAWLAWCMVVIWGRAGQRQK